MTSELTMLSARTIGLREEHIRVPDLIQSRAIGGSRIGTRSGLHRFAHSLRSPKWNRRVTALAHLWLLWLLWLFQVTAAICLSAGSARAQDSCTAIVSAQILGGETVTTFPSDELTVRVGLGTGTIMGGANNQLTINNFRHRLDCDADSISAFGTCDDAGEVVSYVGDRTIWVLGNGCSDINGVPVGFFSNNPDGGAQTNELVFTPTRPIVIDAGVDPDSDAACKIEYAVRALSPPQALDSSPLRTEFTIALSGQPPFDAVCDQPNPIPGVGVVVSRVFSGEQCSVRLQTDFIAGPAFGLPGDIYVVEQGIGTGSIHGGSNNQALVSGLSFRMDCPLGLAAPCLDTGGRLAYGGDHTIWVTGSGCMDINGTPVAFSSNSPEGGALPNELLFTPSAPIVLDPNIDTNSDAACRFQYELVLVDRGDPSDFPSPTPLLVTSVSALSTGSGALLARCFTGLPGSDFTQSQIPLCRSCDDGDACTTESCNRGSGSCETTFIQTCDDESRCTTEGCNTDNGQCETTFAQACNDGNACTTESCNAASGQCETTSTQTCDDGNGCTTETCNTGSGQCETTTQVACDCRIGGCDAASGMCEAVNALTCDDGNACTTEVCDVLSGQCVTALTLVCDDGNACTTELCNVTSGACQTTSTVTCADPACEACETSTGLCEPLSPAPIECPEPDAGRAAGAVWAGLALLVGVRMRSRVTSRPFEPR